MSSQLTKHEVILRFAMHVSLVQISWEDFYIATSAVDLLLVFHCELNHQRFTFIAERLKPTGQGIKPGILACLKTFGTNKQQNSISGKAIIYKFESVVNVIKVTKLRKCSQSICMVLSLKVNIFA